MTNTNNKVYGAYTSAADRRPSIDETITLLTGKGSKTSATSSIDRTFLATGFGMRNVESLDRALKDEERRKQMEMERRKMLLLEQGREQEEEYAGSDKYSDMMSQTESTESSTSTSSASASSESRRRVEYLMGIAGVPLEEEACSEEWEQRKFQEELEERPLKTTEAMRQAQRYLRSHKIFEFFQFLIAHLLSVLPENPIEFITDMLSKCLIFRSGYGEPPLLYNRKHITELFNLMDPIRSGYINNNQYKTGMATLGVCTYNQDPPRNADGLVSKEYFVEEAHERLTDFLNDMIRRRGIGATAPDAPPPTPDMQSQLFWAGGSEGYYTRREKKQE